MADFTESLGNVLNHPDNPDALNWLLQHVHDSLRQTFKQLLVRYRVREVKEDELANEAATAFWQRVQRGDPEFMDKLRTKFNETKTREAVMPLLNKIALNTLFNQLRREWRRPDLRNCPAIDDTIAMSCRNDISNESISAAIDRLLDYSYDQITREIIVRLLLGRHVGRSKGEKKGDDDVGIAMELGLSERSVRRKIDKYQKNLGATDDGSRSRKAATVKTGLTPLAIKSTLED